MIGKLNSLLNPLVIVDHRRIPANNTMLTGESQRVKVEMSAHLRVIQCHREPLFGSDITFMTESDTEWFLKIRTLQDFPRVYYVPWSEGTDPKGNFTYKGRDYWGDRAIAIDLKKVALYVGLAGAAIRTFESPSPWSESYWPGMTSAAIVISSLALSTVDRWGKTLACLPCGFFGGYLAADLAKQAIQILRA